MINAKIAIPVSQFAYSCAKFLLFWVHKCAECVYTEKNEEMQCAICTLKVVHKLIVK